MNKNFPKSALFYTIKDGFTFDTAAMNEQLEEFRFKPCLPESGSSIGFVSPFGESELCYPLNNDAFIARVKYQEKIISSTEVIRLLNEKAKLIEQEEGRLVRGRERTVLKYQIIEELRSTAQSRFKEAAIMALPQLKVLCILGANAALADDITTLLRKAIMSLPIVLAEVKNVKLESLFSGAITSQCFELSDKVKLFNSVADSKASFDYCGWNEGIEELLGDGFCITEIGVKLRGFFSFSFSAEGRPSKLQWVDEITAKSNVEYEAPPTKEGEDYDADKANREFELSVAIADTYLVQLGLETYVTDFISLFGGFKPFVSKAKDETKEKGTQNDATN